MAIISSLRIWLPTHRHGAGDNVINVDRRRHCRLGLSDDVIMGSGWDLTFGGEGDDTINGGIGIDAVRFADGFDKITFTDDNGTVTAVTSSEGTDSLSGIEVYIANGIVKLVNGPGATTHYGFDETFYLAHNTDVADAVAAQQFSSGFDHFMAFGQYEDRNMNALYDADYYRRANDDVAAAVDQGGFQSVTQHYMLYGANEGRATANWFDAMAYLDANLDVKAAGMSALTHYMLFGQGEGRLAYATDNALL